MPWTPGFQSLAGFRIPGAGFLIPKPKIPDSKDDKFMGSGIRTPIHSVTLGYMGKSPHSAVFDHTALTTAMISCRIYVLICDLSIGIAYIMH